MEFFTLTGNYEDEKGNKVIAPKELNNIKIRFKGKNNILKIASKSTISNCFFDFTNSNGSCQIGENNNTGSFKGFVRIGSSCTVKIGDNVTCTNDMTITTAESTKVIIGNDCMFATGNQIRSDDAHAIYDVTTCQRINISKDIIVGNHVWLAYNAILLGGTQIGNGSVVGLGSIVKGKFPNNCVITGIPARITKRNIAWERPNVAYSDVSQNIIINKTSEYWNLTYDDITQG